MDFNKILGGKIIGCTFTTDYVSEPAQVKMAATAKWL